MTRSIRKCLWLFAAFLSCAHPIYSQSQKLPCSLKVEESPEIRGFRLGQTVEQLKAKFPKNMWLEDIDPREMSIVLLDRGDLRRDETYEGLEGVTLRLLDNKVAWFTIKYSGETKWNSQEEFANVIAQSFKLPTAGWKNRYQPTLTCDGFTVETNAGLGGVVGPTVQIKLRGLDEEVERRKLQKEADRRKVFKP